jgi:hypothetical protein
MYATRATKNPSIKKPLKSKMDTKTQRAKKAAVKKYGKK